MVVRCRKVTVMAKIKEMHWEEEEWIETRNLVVSNGIN